MGTNGFSAARGLTTPDQSEALVKRAMVAAARRVVVVSDSTKSGNDHLHRFAHLDEVHLLITDDQLPDEVAAELRDAGVDVVCA
jgi:DeoR family fructose operon transcriptional repressor